MTVNDDHLHQVGDIINCTVKIGELAENERIHFEDFQQDSRTHANIRAIDRNIYFNRSRSLNHERVGRFYTVGFTDVIAEIERLHRRARVCINDR